MPGERSIGALTRGLSCRQHHEAGPAGRFLKATGTSLNDAIFRVYIHESADVESAQQFWLEVTGASADQFRTPTLKRHNPKTVRKNTGDEYHGCLRIDVRRSGASTARSKAGRRPSWAGN